MSVLAAENVRYLSLGVHGLDEVFSGFELGEFVVLYGNAASSMSFTLSVRSQLPVEHGRLVSATVFVDGGNLFSPYAVAETARNCGLDYRAVLNRVYVSRAFTAYQFASLISEKLRAVLKKTRAQLLVVSDITSLFFDRDLSRTEARELFTKTCSTLSEIALEKRAVVVATYFPERRSRQGLFFEAVLFEKCNVLVRLRRRGKILNFVLEKHPNARPFNVDFAGGHTVLDGFVEA